MAEKVKSGMTLKEECEMSRLRAEKERRRSSVERDEFREKIYYLRRSHSRSPGRRSRERYYRDYNSKSRSRSRSRLRDYVRERSLSKERSYSRDRYVRGYSRSPERRERSREREREKGGAEVVRYFSPQYLVHSKDPELMANRLFIGNLPTDRLTEKELVDIFVQYGKVLGVALFKGYGFVQLDSTENARKAVAVENGSLLKGNRIDVKMAHEGRNFRKHEEGGPSDGPSGPFPSHPDHFRGPRPPFPQGPFRPPPPDFYRGPHPSDPYRDPYRPTLPADPYYRDPYRDFYERRDDPYYRGPLPPPPRDPWDLRVIDPLRDPYLDPFRDWIAPPAGKLERPPIDCEIIVTNPKLRDYANMLERRLAGLLMLTYINLLPPEASMTRAIENVSRHKVPYAIILNEQNEAHRSLTLNILHGTPQEHRNMPFDDAMSMLAINFDQYVRDQKEKLTSVPVVPAPAPVAVPSREPPSFKPPDHHMHYLLNLLADKRYLNLEEIDQVLKYLQERRADIIAQRGGLATSSGKMADKEFLERKHAAPPAVDAYMSGGDNEMMNSNHQLSYGGASSNVSADHHTNYGGASSNMSEDHHVTYGGSSAMQHSPSSTVGDTSSQSIRALASSLDNPMVQAALNNLLASGPNLLQNLSAVGGPKASTPSSSAPSSSALASLSMAYDRASPPVEQSIGLSNRLSHHPMQQQSPVRTMRPAVSAAGSRPAGAPALRAPSSQQMAASGRPLSRSPAPNSSHTIRAHATNGPVRSIKPTTRPLW